MAASRTGRRRMRRTAYYMPGRPSRRVDELTVAGPDHHGLKARLNLVPLRVDGLDADLHRARDLRRVHPLDEVERRERPILVAEALQRSLRDVSMLLLAHL